MMLQPSRWLAGFPIVALLWCLCVTAHAQVELHDRWTVFTTFERSDSVPDEAMLVKMPTRLTLKGRTVEARRVQAEDGRFDLSQIAGAGVDKVSFVYVPFESEQAGRMRFGIGADWWFQAWLNGRLIADTLKGGNVNHPPGGLDHVVEADVQQGENLLVIRHISGTASGALALAGPAQVARLEEAERLRIKRSPLDAGAVPNGGFERLADDEGWPAEWINGEGASGFAPGQVTLLRGDAAIAGEVSLVIDTLGDARGRKRKLYVPIEAQVAPQYAFTFLTRVEEAQDHAIVSLRESPAAGTTYQLAAIGNQNAFFSVGKEPGKLEPYEGYTHLNTPRAYLVIQTHGPMRFTLDNFTLRALPDQTKSFHRFFEQRIPRDRDLYTTVSEAVVTPHDRWLKPAMSPPLRLLSVMPLFSHRFTVELAQRMDLTYDTVRFNGPEALGADFFVYDDDGEPALFKNRGDAYEALRREHDVIYVAEIVAHALLSDAAISNNILRKVKAGTGLVVNIERTPMWPGNATDAQVLEVFKGRWAEALDEKNRIAEPPGVALGSIEDADVRYYQYGQGRIAMMVKAPPRDDTHYMARPTIRFREGNLGSRSVFEAQTGFVMKHLLWAAHRVGPAWIGEASIAQHDTQARHVTLPRDQLPADLTVTLNPTHPQASSAITELAYRIDLAQGEWRTLHEGVATIDPQAMTARVPLPVLGHGDHLVHVWAHEASTGRIADWTTFSIRVEHPVHLADLRFDPAKAFNIAGEEVVGSVRVVGRPPAGATLRLSVRDSDGHRWIDREEVLAGKEGVHPVRFVVPQPLTLVHEVSLVLLDAQRQPLGQVSREHVIIREPDYYHGTFGYGIWSIGQGYVYRLGFDALRRKGHMYTWGVEADDLRAHAIAGLRPEPFPGGRAFPEPKPKMKLAGPGKPMRVPSLWDGGYLDEMKRRVGIDAERFARYAPIAYSLGHEVSYLGMNALPHTNFDFAPPSLAEFRNRLRDKYGDLRALNDAWGSRFERWVDVQPPTASQMQQWRSPVGWIEHRRFTDDTFVTFLQRKLDVIRAYDPHALATLDNLYAQPTSFSAIDYHQLYEQILAGSGQKWHLLRSFITEDRRHLQFGRDGAWRPSGITGDAELYRHRFGLMPWKMLFEGSRGYSYWCGFFQSNGRLGDGGGDPEKHNFTPVMHDLRETDMTRDLDASIAQLHTGIDRLMFQSRRAAEGRVGIVYSRGSVHAATAWKVMGHGELPDHQQRAEAYRAALAARGWDPSFVSETRLMDQLSGEPAYRVIILPACVSLPREAVQALRGFVEQGGVLIADEWPALVDEDGQPYTRDDALATLFNLETAWDWVGGAHEVRHISPDDSALPMHARQVGKGWSAYAGAALDADAVAELLSHAGVPAPLKVRVEHSAARPERNDHQDLGRIDIEGIANAEGALEQSITFGEDPDLPVWTHGDAVLFGVMQTSRRGPGVEPVTLLLPHAGHVYDLQDNTYLGQTNRLSIQMHREGKRAFALLKRQTAAPSLQAHADRDDTHGWRIIDVTVGPADTMSEPPRVVRLRLLDAAGGHELPGFAVTRSVMATPVTHRFVLPTDLDAASYVVEARESIGGKTTRVTVDWDTSPAPQP